MLLVSDTTLEKSQVLPPEDGKSTPPPVSGGSRSLVARYAWWLVTLGILAVSAALILILRTRPGYDPYGWLDWGYQTLRGSLNLGGAPSWKPFTYLFNVPYAIFGHYALWLWMETAVAISLAGAVFGGRIAYRLTAADAEHRYAAIAAAIIGGASVLGINLYMHYVMSVQSDPMLVTTCLAAIDCYLNRRYAWTWWLLALTALGRPEVWPFAGLYAIWVWRKFPSMRWMLYVGVIGNAFLWFGIPTITNGRPNIAGQLALRSPRELHNNKIIGTWDRFTSLKGWPIWVLALIAVGLAALRRNIVVLDVGGDLARLGRDRDRVRPARLPRRLPLPVRAGRDGRRTRRRRGRLAAARRADAQQVTAQLGRDPGRGGPGGDPDPRVRSRRFGPSTRTSTTSAPARSRSTSWRRRSTRSAATSACCAAGSPVINVEYASIMAWYVHMNTGLIGYRPQFELTKKHNPIVLLTPLPNGWAVQPYRTPRAPAAAAADIKSLYVPTAFHPGGVLIYK